MNNLSKEEVRTAEEIAYDTWRKLVNQNWSNVAGEIQAAIELYASQFKSSVVREKEEQRFTIEDMVAFAAYLHDHSWEYDYREEKTHSLLEHLDEWIKTRKQ